MAEMENQVTDFEQQALQLLTMVLAELQAIREELAATRERQRKIGDDIPRVPPDDLPGF